MKEELERRRENREPQGTLSNILLYLTTPRKVRVTYHSKRGYTLSELTQCSHTMLQLCPSYQATSTPSHPTFLLFGRAQETQLNRTVSPTCTRSTYIDYRGSKQWHSIRVYIGPRCIEKDSH